MDTILKRKSFLIGSLIVLSIITFVLMQNLISKMEITPHFTISVTSLNTVSDIINQINDEKNNTSKNSNNKNKPSLKDEIEKAKSKLSKEDYKSAKSNYKKMTEHIDKLEKYKQNPMKFDNQGFLKNAPNEQIRQKIINTRIKHLEKEIETFYKNIIKILN